jgi:hypothetical protein
MKKIFIKSILPCLLGLLILTISGCEDEIISRKQKVVDKYFCVNLGSRNHYMVLSDERGRITVIPVNTNSYYKYEINDTSYFDLKVGAYRR